MNKIVSASEFGEHCDLLDEYRDGIETCSNRLKNKDVGYDPYELALTIQKNREKFRCQVNEIRESFFIMKGGKDGQ